MAYLCNAVTARTRPRAASGSVAERICSQSRWSTQNDWNGRLTAISGRVLIGWGRFPISTSLHGKPVIVAWRGKRSVVCAASYEARQFGVRSAMPAIRAERLCPGAVFVPPDFSRYRAVSRATHESFRRHTDLVDTQETLRPVIQGRVTKAAREIWSSSSPRTE